MESPPLNLSFVQRQHPSLFAATQYPEKILQWGTGAFLRGFFADFIHKAQHQGRYQGRIVAIGSTGSGRTQQLNEQDGLFTHYVEGFEQGAAIRQGTLNTAISRSLSSQSQWQEILALAQQPDMEVIVSNTTEAGLQFHADDLQAQPPATFPGKLTAFLYERYRHFEGAPHKGFHIFPFELLTDNGDLLKQYVLQHARNHQLEQGFLEWVDRHNHFYNTLVDRIVTGAPPQERQGAFEEELGYRDDLLTLTEAFRFWAIEGPDNLKTTLPFLQADPQITVTHDIGPYRERKLRILNGAHSVSVALGFLAGQNHVLGCMQDPYMSRFIQTVLSEEILPTLPPEVAGAADFVEDVLDRFSNPYLDHQLINICMEYTAKIRMRIVPTLVRYQEQRGKIPPLMTLGFAAYWQFIASVHQRADGLQGHWNGQTYPIRDSVIHQLFPEIPHSPLHPPLTDLTQYLAKEEIWGTSLAEIPGFTDLVSKYVRSFEQSGVQKTLAEALEGAQ